MKKNKKFLLKQQIGGMLVELMMTLAIAVIIIPFVFRYQQNAIERAHNIAVVRQMEMVQNALEKYITRNRGNYARHAGNFTWTDVTLGLLIQEGLLPGDFSEDGASTDFGTYALRVMKTQDINDRAVLQGVVVLENNNITPLRTHEIVNMGGGKIGYVEDNNVRGGFNVFLTPRSSMGLSNVSGGLVGTTNTLHGNNEYLWRMPSDSELDATMESPLNLEGQDVTNINNASVSKAFFSADLRADRIDIQNMLRFFYRPRFEMDNFVFDAGDGKIVNGSLYSSSGKASINGSLLVKTAQFGSLTAKNLVVKNNMLYLQNSSFQAGADNGDGTSLSTFSFKNNATDLTTNKLTLFDKDDPTISVNGANQTGIVTPRLSVGSYIFMPEGNGSDPTEDGRGRYCWDAINKRVALDDLVLTTLPSRLIAAQKRFRADPELNAGDSMFKLFTDIYLNAVKPEGPCLSALYDGNTCGVMIDNDTSIAEVFTLDLCKVKTVLDMKYKCLKKCFDPEIENCWGTNECNIVKTKNYDTTIAANCKNFSNNNPDPGDDDDDNNDENNKDDDDDINNNDDDDENNNPFVAGDDDDDEKNKDDDDNEIKPIGEQIDDQIVD